MPFLIPVPVFLPLFLLSLAPTFVPLLVTLVSPFQCFLALQFREPCTLCIKLKKKCILCEKNIICKGFLFTCAAPLAFIHFVQPVHNLWYPLPILCCPTLFLNGNSQLSSPCIPSSNMATSI